MSKLLILQTTVPDYRKKFFNFLKENIDNFQLFAGEAYFQPSIKTDNSIIFREPAKNIYLFNRKILFQTGMWKPVLKANFVVLELNPRIISNWVILILRNVLGKKTILWGHAWPRNGKKNKSDIIRNLMRKMADKIIVYTNTQAKELSRKMPNKIILSAPNSLFFSNEMKTSVDKNLIKNIIYVGRLNKDKKPFFLVKAFYKNLNQFPTDVNLIIVGDGPEKNKIESFISSNNLNCRIILKGHISSYDVLKKIYDRSLLSVSPGYIGLSITQSLGFGVPMLVSKNENHSPELEAVIENENSLFFKTDNIDNLSDQLLSFFKNKKYWIAQREKINSYCKENYSIESMAKTFINVIKADEIK
jgi:glycosyltransferase involved in cell wall biosynthesis